MPHFSNVYLSQKPYLAVMCYVTLSTIIKSKQHLNVVMWAEWRKSLVAWGSPGILCTHSF